MIDFLVVHDARTKKPVGLVLTQGPSIMWMARGEPAAALKLLTTINRTFVEERQGDAVIRREVKRGDSGFLAALRYRLVAPLAPLILGTDKTSRSLAEAGAKLWRLLVKTNGDTPVPVTA